MSQNKPSIPAITAWRALLRAGPGVLSAVETDLKLAGFPAFVWYDALVELRAAGSEGLRPGDLERRLLLAQYTVSRLVDRLERAGLVDRRSCPEDARSSLLTATPAGLDLQARMWPAYAAAIQFRLGAFLTDAEAAELSRLLGKLQEA